jgi:hypothetical protein
MMVGKRASPHDSLLGAGSAHEGNAGGTLRSSPCRPRRPFSVAAWGAKLKFVNRLSWREHHIFISPWAVRRWLNPDSKPRAVPALTGSALARRSHEPGLEKLTGSRCPRDGAPGLCPPVVGWPPFQACLSLFLTRRSRSRRPGCFGPTRAVLLSATEARVVVADSLLSGHTCSAGGLVMDPQGMPTPRPPTARSKRASHGPMGTQLGERLRSYMALECATTQGTARSKLHRRKWGPVADAPTSWHGNGQTSPSYSSPGPPTGKELVPAASFTPPSAQGQGRGYSGPRLPIGPASFTRRGTCFPGVAREESLDEQAVGRPAHVSP